MDEKIKKTATKLQGLVKHYDGPPGEVYYDVRKIAETQSDYFYYLGPDNIIKLTLYIYSLKKTGDLKLGEKMINNLSFVQLLTTENKSTIKECESCAGAGTILCQESADDLPFAKPDELVSTVVNAPEYVPAKLAAMKAHATQISVDGPFFALSNNLGLSVWGDEYYTLVKGEKSAPFDANGRELDIFAGINI